MNSIFPRSLDRIPYILCWLIWVMILCALWALMRSLLLAPWACLAVAIVVYLLKLYWLDIARLHSIGWSPILILAQFVPLLNVIVQILLFFVPPKKPAQG